MKHYDYLLVGGGLYNGVLAYMARQVGKTCLVVERREHLGGNLYCEEAGKIHVHMYGAHIFHTDNEEVWNFVNSLVPFNRYTNSPIANYAGKLYHLPFNMNTFHELWGVTKPKEAKKIIDEQRKAVTGTPKNLKEQAISLVGTDIYEKLIKGYTEKQWGRPCEELPAFIIKRLPVRYTYDNNYFNSRFQGIPMGGYTPLIEKLYEGCDVKLSTDYLEHRDELDAMADKVIYTGTIDSFFDYKFGELEYRSLEFDHARIEMPNYQGCAVMNYTEDVIPYTRIIEHAHFEFVEQDYTVVTREYPAAWDRDKEPYYPINDDKNNALYEKYKQEADKISSKVLFGGRLGGYKYYDMDKIIEEAWKLKDQI